MAALSPTSPFLVELQERFDAEHRLATLLATLMADMPDAQVSTACQHCLQVTTAHIHTLEHCFACCGAKPARATSLVSEALVRMYADCLRAHPAASLLLDMHIELFATMTALAVSSYQRLIALGTAAAIPGCVSLLQENLGQTLAMTQQIERLHGMIARNKPVTYPCANGI